MEELLIYGLGQDGQLKKIAEVENGLACNCSCPNCKHPLVAKNNSTNKKAPHFAHASGRECKGAIETVVHLLAKEVIKETKTLLLPDFYHDYEPLNIDSFSHEGQLITFDEILLESREIIDGQTIIPDAIGICRSRRIYIEFAKTHFIDVDKKHIIKKSGVSCIEINLKYAGQNKESIQQLLLNNTGFKYWISNPRLKKQCLNKLAIDRDMDINYEDIYQRKAKERLFDYTLTKKFHVLKIDEKYFYAECPIRRHKIEELRNSDLYKVDLLKEIIDGALWDGRIHGKSPYKLYTFINRKQVVIYPELFHFNEIPEEKKDELRFFYKGLLTIKSTLLEANIGYCNYCKFTKEILEVDKVHYSICSYK